MDERKQRYEKYWPVTLWYSDFFGENFLTSLAIVLQFIDETAGNEYSPTKYRLLQERIQRALSIADGISARKCINELVKLGLVRPRLRSYHPAAKAFLNEPNREKKRALLSKIIYADASFDRAVTKESEKKEVNFLIKTLAEVGSLNREDVLALMTIDVSTNTQGFLTRAELEERKVYISTIEFEKRKYNQRDHLWAVLRNLDGLQVTDGTVVFGTRDSVGIDEPEEISRKRDSYLQQIYKAQLIEESKEVFGEASCMLLGLPFPGLIASHIKPHRNSTEDEAFDPYNGLLLSRTMDFLFDKGLISFSDDGSIIVSATLPKSVQAYVSTFRLHSSLLTAPRRAYLEYHRASVFVPGS